MRGRCVICSAAGRLTNDHVPPRSVSPPTPLELVRFGSAGEFGRTATLARRGFQAATFPSLCRVCNTDRLGGEYDPTLAQLAADVRRWVAVTMDLDIQISSDIEATTQPFRLARSVIGHLLAAEERKDPSAMPPQGTLTTSLREFFLDETAPWPEGMYLYTWLYPAKNQIIVRGFGISRVLGARYGPIIGDVLKFFPLAFWITAAPADVVRYRLTAIPLEAPSALDSEVTLRIPLRGYPPAGWPEQPGDDEIVLMNLDRTSVGVARP